ncbi:small ribosomal subunit protein uS7m [Parasteatoda tepidariorum]|uniref:small ribosomal subunit protein uS7m n=1 Tax=Parasteatoda tepidariorum TaxID=114398 RepID=UPI00077FA778|nr:28S ribosomal protein S7, mitochondrial-like [Parasteatoda tepidariorum]
MASLRIFMRKEIRFHNIWCPIMSNVRSVLYPSTHLDPIPNREYLDQLEEEGKLDALKVMPVKPAPSTMTNSLYDDPEFNYFTSLLMKWSQRSLARNLMYEVFARIKRIQLGKYHAATEEERSSIELDPKKIFYSAIHNCKPVLTVTPVKKGGITYQVPVPVSTKHSKYMAMKWLIAAGRDKEGPTHFVEQMTKELLDAFYNEGRVVKRKHDLHKLCENNKAYAHYRWS